VRPRILNRARMRALPWPVDIPRLEAKHLCPYLEPKIGRRHLWDILAKLFDPTTGTGREMSDQFLYLLMDVINENLDARDKNNVCPSDIPSSASYNTKAPYSCAEVAAWWNETVDRLRAML